MSACIDVLLCRYNHKFRTAKIVGSPKVVVKNTLCKQFGAGFIGETTVRALTVFGGNALYGIVGALGAKARTPLDTTRVCYCLNANQRVEQERLASLRLRSI